MKAGRIFLIRHGQTAWNKVRYQGWGDPPLDQCGREQSETIWNALKEEPIDKVFSSSLIRAVETIRPLVTRKQLPILLSDDLRELNYGLLEGKMKKDHPLKVKKNNLHLPVPGGESLSDLYGRAVRFIEGITSDLFSKKNIIIVGHYWSNRMVLGAILGSSFDAVITESDYRPKNGSILEISYEIDPEDRINFPASHLRDTLLNKRSPL
ncbi:MAG: histidine phosphatase family protein [Nitrospiria bacterium]